jgi:hypothetical protein
VKLNTFVEPLKIRVEGKWGKLRASEGVVASLSMPNQYYTVGILL